MYIPRKFALTDEQTAAALAAAEFAQLVTHDSTGLLVKSALPSTDVQVALG